SIVCRRREAVTAVTLAACTRRLPSARTTSCRGGRRVVGGRVEAEPEPSRSGHRRGGRRPARGRRANERGRRLRGPPPPWRRPAWRLTDGDARSLRGDGGPVAATR